jgi:tetratricopeptide (TPR) repeat protein
MKRINFYHGFVSMLYSFSNQLFSSIFILAVFLITGCVPSSYMSKIYLSTAEANSKSGNMDTAIRYYGLAISKDDRNAIAYNGRAKNYSRLGNYTAALSDAEKAISINKHYWDAYYTRGVIYEKQELYNQSVSDYSQYILRGDKKVADYYLGYWGRGKCNQKLKNYNEAIKDFTDAIRIKESDNYLFSWRGQCYIDMEKYAEAAKDFERFLQPNTTNFKEQFLLGICYVKLNEKEKAEKVFLKLAESDPSLKEYFPGEKFADFFNPELRRKLTGQALAEATDYINEALSISSKTLLDIKYADAFEKLQTAWGYGSNYTREDGVLLDSIKSKMFFLYPKLNNKPAIPEYVRKFTVQATNFVEDKNYQTAIELYQRVLTIVPYYPLARFNLAMLYATSNDYRNAIRLMNDYLKLSPDAKDARSVQDKIYGWELRVKN